MPINEVSSVESCQNPADLADSSLTEMVTASPMARDLRTSKTIEQESGIFRSTSGLGRVPLRVSLWDGTNVCLTSPVPSAILGLGKHTS